MDGGEIIREASQEVSSVEARSGDEEGLPMPAASGMPHAHACPGVDLHRSNIALAMSRSTRP